MALLVGVAYIVSVIVFLAMIFYVYGKLLGVTPFGSRHRYWWLKYALLLSSGVFFLGVGSGLHLIAFVALIIVGAIGVKAEELLRAKQV